MPLAVSLQKLGEGFPTKIDYGGKIGYQLILTSLLEDLASVARRSKHL